MRGWFLDGSFCLGGCFSGVHDFCCVETDLDLRSEGPGVAAADGNDDDS